MFFPLWLALLHALHLPYLVAGAGLWCAASLLAAFAAAPLWCKKEPGRARLYTLGLFGLLACLPSSWAAYTLRVYRDNIFPALCLFFFAGMAGAALRAVLCPAGKTRLWPWLLAAGAGLACGYLDREDAGLFLLPFGAAATLILLVVLARARRWRACAAQLIPYGMLAAAVLAFCGMNQSRYGVFALSDFSEGPFAAAMGAMMRVDTGNDDPLLSVPADARQKLYAAVPELEPLAYWLEEDPQMRNDFQDPERQDYRAGSFYWAIRRAAQYEGVYDSARTAADYWQSVADAVNAACDDGTLPSRTGKRAATSQPVKLSYVAPTLAETARSVVHVLAFADCAPYETARSIGTGGGHRPVVRLPALRFQQRRRGREGHPLLQPVPETGLWLYGSRRLGLPRPAVAGGAGGAGLPFCGAARHTAPPGAGHAGALAAAVGAAGHGAAALRHDRLCGSFQLRHRHQHHVPGYGAPAVPAVCVFITGGLWPLHPPKGVWPMTDLLILGGGAAGLMAAGAACVRGLRVTVVEHNPKGPGQKLLITGKGRCNVTSDSDVRDFLPFVRHNGRFLYSSLYAFPPSAAMELFEELGVPLKTERGRRVFPQSDRAADVLAALRAYARDARFVRGSAQKLLLEDGVCKGAVTDRGETLRAAATLVATGGISYPATGSDGSGYALARQAGAHHRAAPAQPVQPG